MAREMRIENVTEVRQELLEIFRTGEKVVATRKGRPIAVILPYEEYQEMAAARDLAQDPEALLEAFRAHDRIQMGLPATPGPMQDVATEEHLRDIERLIVEQSLALHESLADIRSRVDRVAGQKEVTAAAPRSRSR